jgi:hypothetical protein
LEDEGTDDSAKKISVLLEVGTREQLGEDLGHVGEVAVSVNEVDGFLELNSGNGEFGDVFWDVNFNVFNAVESADDDGLESIRADIESFETESIKETDEEILSVNEPLGISQTFRDRVVLSLSEVLVLGNLIVVLHGGLVESVNVNTVGLKMSTLGESGISG